MNQHIERILKAVDIPSAPPRRTYKLFIFGRNPILSLAELVSMFKSSQHTFEIADISPFGVLINQDKGWYPSAESSGTILKRCTPLLWVEKPVTLPEIQRVTTLLEALYIEEKSSWSISVYNEQTPEDTHVFNNLYEVTRSYFKEKKLKCMFVQPKRTLDRLTYYREIAEEKKKRKKRKEKNKGKRDYYNNLNARALMPRTLHRKRMLTKGIELVLWHRKNDVAVCRTEQALDIDDLKKRDMKRPCVRPMLGISAALARTMVNLAMQPEGSTVYDPFCGTGTIVQEAFLSGYNAVGSDIDSQSVKAAGKNLQWIAKTYNKKNFPQKNLFALDFNRAIDVLEKGSFDAIVTEPYLAPPLRRYPDFQTAQEIIRDASTRYAMYLRCISYLLRENGVCVIILPRIRTDKGRSLSLGIENLLSRFQLHVHTEQLLNVHFAYAFVHAPKSQRIEREIYVLRRGSPSKLERSPEKGLE